MTHTLLRSILFSTTAAFLLSACADEAEPEATLTVTFCGNQHEAWKLTGPAAEAPLLADELATALAAADISSGDSTASIANGDSTVEVPLDPAASEDRIASLADAHGFAIEETTPPSVAGGDAKFDASGPNRGRIARAEVMNVLASRKDSKAIWNQRTGYWTIYTQKDGGGIHSLSRQWGMDYDYPLAGDYDGDGRSDTMIWRPSTGQWFLWTASGWRPPTPVVHGAAGDIPVPGDYNGDRYTDYAFFRARTGEWKIRYANINGGAGPTQTFVHGTSLSIPVPGDYDGDGKTDLAFFLNGRFTVRKSRDNTSVVYFPGVSSGIPMPGDYDGDNKTDPGVFGTNGYWTILESSRNYAAGQGATWGYGTSDLPVGGNFDSDSRMDFNVFRPADAIYYSLGYTGSSNSYPFGSNSYTPSIPVPGPYRHHPSEQVTLP